MKNLNDDIRLKVAEKLAALVNIMPRMRCSMSSKAFEMYDKLNGIFQPYKTKIVDVIKKYEM